MAPSVVVSYADHTIKTSVKLEAGQPVEWNETLEMENFNDEEVTITMKDDNATGKKKN